MTLHAQSNKLHKEANRQDKNIGYSLETTHTKKEIACIRIRVMICVYLYAYIWNTKLIGLPYCVRSPIALGLNWIGNLQKYINNLRADLTYTKATSRIRRAAAFISRKSLRNSAGQN